MLLLVGFSAIWLRCEARIKSAASAASPGGCASSQQAQELEILWNAGRLRSQPGPNGTNNDRMLASSKTNSEALDKEWILVWHLFILILQAHCLILQTHCWACVRVSERTHLHAAFWGEAGHQMASEKAFAKRWMPHTIEFSQGFKTILFQHAFLRLVFLLQICSIFTVI